MFYLNVSGSGSVYSYTPFQHVRIRSANTFEELHQQVNGFLEYLQPGNGFSAIHCTIYSVDEETGALEIHYNHLGKVPLRKRKVINALADGAVKKAKLPSPVPLQVFLDEMFPPQAPAVGTAAPEGPF